MSKLKRNLILSISSIIMSASLLVWSCSNKTINSKDKIENIADNTHSPDPKVKPTVLPDAKLTKILPLQFWKQKLGKMLNLPEVIEIGERAFSDSVFTDIHIRKVKQIGAVSFESSKISNLDLPFAETIGENAFFNSPLTFLYCPSANNISFNAFANIINESTTNVTLPSAFNNNEDKDRIFGKGNWNNVSFNFVNKPNIESHNFGNMFIKNGRKKYTQWLTIDDKRKESFFSSINLPDVATIYPNAFYNSYIVSLKLPKVKEIYDNAFYNSRITSLSLPLVEKIGKWTFYNSRITSLYLPNIKWIGLKAFRNSKITNLNLPKVKGISSDVFRNIVNEKTTTVTLPSKFNNDKQKNIVFGIGNWNKITFNFV